MLILLVRKSIFGYISRKCQLKGALENTCGKSSIFIKVTDFIKDFLTFIENGLSFMTCSFLCEAIYRVPEIAS